MPMLDKLFQQDPLKKIIDGQLHWHYSLLKKWDKNEEYRIMYEKGWSRLRKSIKKYGIKDPFEIDEEGTIYDGNHRYEGDTFWINQGVRSADNGKSLEWIPVNVHYVPKTDVEALDIAAKANGDKDFAVWNKDAVTNHKDLFDQVEDIGDMAFTFDEALTFDDNYEFLEEPVEEKPAKEKKETCEKCENYHTNEHQII